MNIRVTHINMDKSHGHMLNQKQVSEGLNAHTQTLKIMYRSNKNTKTCKRMINTKFRTVVTFSEEGGQ